MANESYFDWTAKLFDVTKIFGKPEALKGIRVLDLSLIIFGPATADYLGERSTSGGVPPTLPRSAPAASSKFFLSASLTRAQTERSTSAVSSLNGIRTSILCLLF